MTKKIDLTQGNIALQLIKVSLPIMFTSFFQMAYNLTDMFWIGRLGSGAVATIGSAGFFMWLGMSVVLCAKVGIEVTVAQSAGKNDYDAMKHYIISGLSICVLLALFYSVIIFSFSSLLINFFGMGNDVNGYDPTANAIFYLRILSCGMIFSFFNPSCSAIYNGLGKTKTAFYYNSVGLLVNMVLDPILIFGLFGLPKLQVAGAAIATITAQAVVSILFALSLRKNFDFFHNIISFISFSKQHCFKILKIGFPPSLQNMLFAIIAICTARIIGRYGAIPIAVQRIGSQIEAISWMTSSGFSTALCAFIGQNYGAGKIKRVWQGFITGTSIMCGLGVVATLILMVFPEQLYKIFVSEPDTIAQGVVYLKILAFSQLFMCIETSSAGTFNGLGKSIPPSIVGVVFNFLRIPGALIFSAMIGLNGIWWSISGSSIIKGIVLTAWFVWFFRRFPPSSSSIHA